MPVTIDGTSGINTPGVVNSGNETIGGNLGVTGTVTLTTTLGVAQGGTGATSLTANNVILGNGTSAVQLVAPGSTGNVLTSNGTTWTSAAAAASGFSNMTVYTSPGTFTTPATTNRIKVTVAGGGGGGRGGSPSSGGQFGGAGGGTAIYVGPVSASTPYPVTVGSGGSPGGIPLVFGGTGGTSSFGSLASATGGAGGAGSPTNTIMLGGEGTTGTLLVKGATNGSNNGVPSMFGGGGAAGPSSVNPGGNYGGGAGAGSTVNVGGAGGGGVVIVEF